jgi:hypothetical protein
MERPAGERDDGSRRVDFGRRLKLEFHGGRIAFGAGLAAYRELDDAPGLADSAGGVISGRRRGENAPRLPACLFRQSVFGCLAGCKDGNDAMTAMRRRAHWPQYWNASSRNESGLADGAQSSAVHGRVCAIAALRRARPAAIDEARLRIGGRARKDRNSVAMIAKQPVATRDSAFSPPAETIVLVEGRPRSRARADGES